MTVRHAPVSDEARLQGYRVTDAHGGPCGVVLVDQRSAYPRNRLVIEHGHWLWRRRVLVARAHVVAMDPQRRTITLDLDRHDLARMPSWDGG